VTTPKSNHWLRKNARRDTWPTVLEGWAMELEALAEAAQHLQKRIYHHSMNTDIDTSQAWFDAEDACSEAAEDISNAAGTLRRAATKAGQALNEDQPFS
jgi:hypothetical protein